MKRLITEAEHAQLIQNGIQAKKCDRSSLWPVVRLFMPDGGETWLLSELDPENPNMAFGLFDCGLGFLEVGNVRISELVSIRGPQGLPIERDLGFKAEKSILEYANDMYESLKKANSMRKNSYQSELDYAVNDIRDKVINLAVIMLEECHFPFFEEESLELYSFARNLGDRLSLAALLVYIDVFAEIITERVKS